MCGAWGPWPSSSCASCYSFQICNSSSQAPRSAPSLNLNRCTAQAMVPAAFMDTQVGREDVSFAAPSSALISDSSFLKRTALRIITKRSPRQERRSTSPVTNFMIAPGMNLEKLAVGDSEESGSISDGKHEEKVLLRKPQQLELRRPGHAVDEVVRPAVKLVHHHFDSPVVGLHVQSKVQVRPKKPPGHNKHLRAKLPRFFMAHRESRPRISSGDVCSAEVFEAVASLRRSWSRDRSIVDVMEKYAKSLTPRDISCMLTELQRQHDWQCTLELFYWIKKQPWHHPNSRLYTRLIGFLGRQGQVDRATLLFQEMLLEKCKPDQYTFTAMLNAYGKARMFKEAIAVFNYMKECSEPGCQPNTVTCNALIDALAKGGLYDLAVKTFFDMRDGTNGLEHGCQPNVITYNVLIDALCKERLVEVGVRVLHQMREGDLDQTVLPNTATYNTIIDACGKGGLYEKAEELMEEMVEHGVQPDHITYTALIDAYGKAGLWECAENTFKGMKGAHVSVDVMAYTAMIDAYAKDGIHEKAEELFKMMQQAGIRPNQVTYLALIDAYGKGGLPEEARSVFMAMQAAGYEGNVLIYSALIDAYGKAGCYKEAAEMFEMMREAGCHPNLITYAAVLSSCSRCTSWEDALVLLKSFQDSDIKIERTLYKLVLGASVNDKLFEDLSEILEETAGQAMATQLSFCNSLINVLWSCGLCGRAARVLSLAREIGVYNNDKCSNFTKSEWCLDLHRFSVGAAITMLLTWLEELHLAWIWGEDTPEMVVVITGKGKHSKSRSSVLKAPVDNQLAQLGSPFADLAGNWGRLTASGVAVQEWLLSPGVKQRLSLVDVKKPRPSYLEAIDT